MSLTTRTALKASGFRSRYTAAEMAMLLIPLFLGGTITYRLIQAAHDRASESLAWGLRPAQRLVYHVELNSEAASDMSRVLGDGSSQTQMYTANFAGDLVATILNVEGSHFSVAYCVRNPSVRLNGALSGIGESIERDLARETFAVVDRRGRIVGVRSDPATSSAGRRFLRSILAASQFVVPDQFDASSWDVEECAPEGKRVVRYASADGDSSDGPGIRRFQKTATRYLPAGPKARLRALPATTERKPSGSLLAQFDVRAGRLVSLSGGELQTVTLGGTPISQSATTQSLELISEETVSDDEMTALIAALSERQSSTELVPLSHQESRAPEELERARKTLNGATLDSLLAELRDAETSTDDAASALVAKLHALVRVQPKASPTLGTLLAKADAASRAFGIITQALTMAADDTAQAALSTAIAARRDDWSALQRLIPALGRMERPAELAELTLWQLSQTAADEMIATTAQLALGMMARNLDDFAPERAAEIVSYFVGRLESAETAADKRQFLLVLGNAGLEQSFAAVRQCLNDKQPDVRAAAVSALRWLENAEIEPNLLNVLATDADAGVRAEVASALSFRPMTADVFQAFQKSARQDSSPRVRMALLRQLWREKKNRPDISQLASESATNDASEDVRRVAAELLGNER